MSLAPLDDGLDVIGVQSLVLQKRLGERFQLSLVRAQDGGGAGVGRVQQLVHLRKKAMLLVKEKNVNFTSNPPDVS